MLNLWDCDALCCRVGRFSDFFQQFLWSDLRLMSLDTKRASPERKSVILNPTETQASWMKDGLRRA